MGDVMALPAGSRCLILPYYRRRGRMQNAIFSGTSWATDACGSSRVGLRSRAKSLVSALSAAFDAERKKVAHFSAPSAPT